MTPDKRQKHNRLIALSFASVLLLLVYGPLAQWFVAADRLLYDNLASHLPRQPLGNAFIVSIDPAKADPESLINTYGNVVNVLQNGKVRRIIMTEPPKLAGDRAFRLRPLRDVPRVITLCMLNPRRKATTRL
ncbi:MAG: hypothetical protein O2907_04765 [Proteobacteria bacterium]|nr:hypothetical protein [Pseudomonadota bacterium]MDA1063638.1 hypothetical protein [Pseudomonadota bacterium]